VSQKNKSEQIHKKLQELQIEIQDFKEEFSVYQEKVRRALLMGGGGDNE
jgi:uncharacterized coiled-coil DUF342 family protein